MREAFFEDEIDVAISEMPWGIPTYLFESRIAPLQIYSSRGFHYWSLQNVDQLVLPQEAEKINENTINIAASIDKKFLKQPIDKDELNRARQLYPSNCMILGSIQRLIKLSIEYLEICKKILLENKNTILILAGPGDESIAKEYFTKAGLDERVFFPGYVNPHIYSNVIDIYLDSFPFPSGHSAIESMAYNTPVVHMYIKEWAPMSKSRDQELVAYSDQEYLNITNKLIGSKKYYNEKSNISFELIKDYFDISKSAKDFENLYKSLL